MNSSDAFTNHTSAATSRNTTLRRSDCGTTNTAPSIVEPVIANKAEGNASADKEKSPPDPSSALEPESDPSASFSSSCDSSDPSSSKTSLIALRGIGAQWPHRVGRAMSPTDVARDLAAARGPRSGPQRVRRRHVPSGPASLGQSAGRRRRGKLKPFDLESTILKSFRHRAGDRLPS